MFTKLQDPIFFLLNNYRNTNASLTKLYARNIFYQRADNQIHNTVETSDSLKTIPMLLLQFIVCLRN